MIPVSGIHPSLFNKLIHTDADNKPTFHQHLLNIKETSREAGKPATYIFASIEASNLREKTGKWYFITTDEKYKSAVMFIDRQLIDIYYQEGFDKLEQTRRSPFHRGPHRLTKLSEAASQHAQHLQLQKSTGPPPPPIRPPPTRASAKLVYDLKQFPPLSTHTRVRTQPISVRPPTTTDESTKSTPIPPSISKRLEALESSIKQQQQQIGIINTTLTDQQQAIEKLTTLLTTQQETITEFKEAVLTLTQSVTTLKQVTTKLLETSTSNQSSPDHEKAGKRIKIRTDETSPTNIRRPILDDPMEDVNQWESQTPNMTQPNSRSSSPSL